MSKETKPAIITRNGQSVECWGIWEEDSNAYAVFEDEALDGTFCEFANYPPRKEASR